ncbi:Fe-S cluster assembly sulfur transfer protein SufU [Nostoc sp.]|uniref:Fe-S cluster assembly sulfur transfer protein SufU n=1 Tax=Nostoc sp. TaxID=1180 RepID=UPI002FF7AEBA
MVGSSPKEVVFAQAAEAALQGAQLPQYNSFKIELAKRAIGKTNPVHRQHRGENPYCGDVVELTLALDETESKIADIKFEGAGYGLCLASAEFMAIAIKGKSITQALLIVEQFHEMVTGHTQFEPPWEKLNIIQGVSQYPMRVKCVTLAWHTLKVALGSVETGAYL